MRSKELCTLTVLGLLALRARASVAAPFDLAGPTLEVEVTRAGQTLPAAEVPNLSVGDRIAVRADFSAPISANYLIVAAFLRGATNPPPESWFVACKTWTRRCAREGLTLTVPEDARQLLVFLAPWTGGAFKTLVNAVRGRPGAFVRTSQDLHQAALDHARLEAYLAAVRHLGDVDPARLKEAAPLLARSLAMKVDEACLDKIPVLQAPCLAQGRESLIMDDGRSASLAQALTSGAAGDLALEASNTPQLKSGYYGPFIGSIFDIAKIFDSLHTAQYQYIPALTTEDGRKIALTLNAPPSFHDPKSVLVVALPAVEAPQFPALHPVNPSDVLCTNKDPLVLPVEGAPVVFSTAHAHDAVLRLTNDDGSTIELSAQPDPVRGGYVVSLGSATSGARPGAWTASLHARWGFDRYDGPSFKLVDAQAQVWSLVPGDSPDRIVGRADTIHLRADSTSCLKAVTLEDAAAKVHTLQWKKISAKEVELSLPLQDVPAGNMTVRLSQFGRLDTQSVALRAFEQAGHLESFALHAGDTEGILRGNRLDEVRQVDFGGVYFTPGTLSSHDGRDELPMLAQSGSDTRTLKPGQAHVTLRDGRIFEVKAAVDSPRPIATLISTAVDWLQANSENTIQLSKASELPLEAVLTFSVRAQSPAAFGRDEKLEVATADGTVSAVLGVGTGEVVLQSRSVAVVTLNPAKALGASAFGRLQFRRVVDGIAGDWVALATLVRLPRLAGVDCQNGPEDGCSLTGSNLFLLDSVSADADFAHRMRVPDGFTAAAFRVPHPLQGKLYVRLRDDPLVVNVAVVTVKEPVSTSPDAGSASPGTEPLREKSALGAAARTPANAGLPAGEPTVPVAAGHLR